MDKRDFSQVKRVVVKVGSSSLTYTTGKLNIEQIEHLVRQIADLHNRGLDVLLVSSGAVGAGMGKLGLATRRPRTIPEKQAAAAVGQGILLHMYEKIFAEYGVIVGQVLLTREDIAHRQRFLNARNTLQTMLTMGVVPVINENDTVAIDEIKLGDNDNLAALVACLVDADLMVLLSDVDGLYDGSPNTPGAQLINEVHVINQKLEALAGGVGSAVGTGGMVTKIQAGRIAMHSGVVSIIANASEKDILRRLIAGERLGTVFWPAAKLVNKKRWIAFGAKVCGNIHIDPGAAKALKHHGKSLLPSGIVQVDGDFAIGNTVNIIAPDGQEMARGIVNYDAREVNLIKGKKTCEIAQVLGYKDFDEVIHRDNLALE